MIPQGLQNKKFMYTFFGYLKKTFERKTDAFELIMYFRATPQTASLFDRMGKSIEVSQGIKKRIVEYHYGLSLREKIHMLKGAVFICSHIFKCMQV